MTKERTSMRNKTNLLGTSLSTICMWNSLIYSTRAIPLHRDNLVSRRAELFTVLLCSRERSKMQQQWNPILFGSSCGNQVRQRTIRPTCKTVVCDQAWSHVPDFPLCFACWKVAWVEIPGKLYAWSSVLKTVFKRISRRLCRIDFQLAFLVLFATGCLTTVVFTRKFKMETRQDLMNPSADPL